MQILEATDFAVRSAVLHLTRRTTPLRFEVFPMIHIGEPAFYEEVATRLRRCDLIIAEGVGGPAETAGDTGPENDDLALDWPGLELDDLPPAPPRSGFRWDPLTALTSSYRLPARFDRLGRLGLVEQRIDYGSLGVPVLCPDMTDAEFTAGWRALPAWQRAIGLIGAPLAGVGLLAFGSRRSLAGEMALDDTDWHQEDFELADLIGAKRDRLLMNALEAVHEVSSGEEITVAIVYGAEHVPPLTRGLWSRYGYSVRAAEWLTVFGLDE
jgi:hypothetical protein